MLSLMNKCYRIYIACILFIDMRYTFGMLLLKHPVSRLRNGHFQLAKKIFGNAVLVTFSQKDGKEFFNFL